MKIINLIKFMMLLLLSLAITPVFAEDTSTTNGTTTTIDASTPTTTNMSSDDSSINSKVKSFISSNRQISKARITVVTQDGVVTLTGNLNSNKLAQALILAAASIKGVKDVDTTNLTVNNAQLLKDLAITAKVKGALIRERNGLAKSIKVQTNNGVVTLTGNVSTQDQAEQAIQLAKSVNGVDTVQSKITVKGKTTNY